MAQKRIILDRYAQIERMGAGATGSVDLCWDTRIRRYVAIKRLPLSASATRAGAAGTPGLAEARMAASLNHPNIVSVYDFDVAGDEALLIMEAIGGPALSDILDETPPGQLDRDIIASIAQSTAAALQFAHDNGVLHLDVKPDNILVDLEGRTKLSDFGISELADARGLASPTGGTIGYMPPEQLRTEELDQRCDVFALGMVVYEMLTGENPFFADSLDASRKLIERFDVAAPSTRRDDVGRDLDDVVVRAIEPDWRERYVSTEDFMRDLLPLLGSARRGTAKLKEAVNAVDDDAQAGEGEDGGHGARRAAGTGMHGLLQERFTPRRLLLAGRITSFLLCWWTAALGLVAFGVLPTGTAMAAALAVGALGLAGHGIGALAAIALVGGALVYVPAGPAGVGAALLAAGLLWWVFAGRRGVADANCALSAVPLGLAWLAPVAPFLAGLCLPPARAAASAAMSWLLAWVLAVETKSASLLHCGLALDPSAGDLSLLADMAKDPATWLAGTSWVAAAVLFSLIRSRRTRLSSIMGGCVAGVVAIAVQVLVASSAAGALAAPDLPWTLATAAGWAVATFLAAATTPGGKAHRGVD